MILDHALIDKNDKRRYQQLKDNDTKHWRHFDVLNLPKGRVTAEEEDSQFAILSA